MRNFILATIIFSLTTQITYSQHYDSTQFKTYPLESVVIKSWSIIDENIDDTLKLYDSSDRSSLLILDPALRHCYITAKLIEYKSGIKIRDAIVLFKEAIYSNPKIATFEDSAFVFSLYRKPQKGNQFIWGFRTPSTMQIEKVEMPKPEYSLPYLVDLQERKLPIGKPFVFLIITTPDSKGNLPFFNTEHKNKYRPYDWNKIFNLSHTFIIELTIEKSTDYKQNDPT
jgi:hypothetical protein